MKHSILITLLLVTGCTDNKTKVDPGVTQGVQQPAEIEPPKELKNEIPPPTRPDVREVVWGMTLGEVKVTEAAEFRRGNKNELVYRAKFVEEMDAVLWYFFNEGKLYKALFKFEFPKREDPQHYVGHYDALVRKLDELPAFQSLGETVSWQEGNKYIDLYRGRRTSYGNLMKTGQIESLQTTWSNPRTKMYMILASEGICWLVLETKDPTLKPNLLED